MKFTYGTLFGCHSYPEAAARPIPAINVTMNRSLMDSAWALFKLTNDWKPDSVVTVSESGVPLATLVAGALGVDLHVCQRQTVKTHRVKPSFRPRIVKHPTGVVSVVGAKIVSLPHDAIKPGERSIFVDDRLITGATARAVVDMIYEGFNATILGIVVAERHFDGDPKLNWIKDLPIDCLHEVGKREILFT